MVPDRKTPGGLWSASANRLPTASRIVSSFQIENSSVFFSQTTTRSKASLQLIAPLKIRLHWLEAGQCGN